jgi:Fe/S biogenesis protein NfuA
MITVTDTARLELVNLIEKSGPYIGLRLVVTGEVPGAYRPELMFMQAGQESPADRIVQNEDLKIFIGPESIDKVDGLKIELIHTQAGPRLKFDFPSIKWDDPIAQRVQDLIDQHINPSLMSHGGYAALLDVNDGVAEVLMGGGCQGCMLSAQTLSQSIEVTIKHEIPEIHTVVDRTNHAVGTNPYYRQDHPGGATPPASDGEGSKSSRRRASRKK